MVIRPFIALLVIALAAAACARADQPAPPTRVVPTLFPTLPATAAPPAGSPADEPSSQDAPADSGWLAGARGVELRRVRVAAAEERPGFPAVVVRIDPAAVRLRVGYAPDAPRGLGAWFGESRPLVAVNGGFFDEAYRATALVVSDGVASGASYQGFGGMLTVGPDGAVGIQALRDAPYDPGAPLAQAVQSFPMLVFPGGVPAQVEDNGERARRTAVALDRSGRLLIVVCPTSALTLGELAGWLAGSDLGVERALNLDGGSSTGLIVQAGELSERVDPFGPLPIVIFAESR